MPEPKLSKRKPGRPKMAKGEATSSAVNLRFTAEYRKRLEAAAKAKGHTLSTLYGRHLMQPSEVNALGAHLCPGEI